MDLDMSKYIVIVSLEILVYIYGGCSKFLFLFPVIQALALRPCAVLRGCGFKHIGR